MARGTAGLTLRASHRTSVGGRNGQRIPSTIVSAVLAFCRGATNARFNDNRIERTVRVTEKVARIRDRASVSLNLNGASCWRAGKIFTCCIARTSSISDDDRSSGRGRPQKIARQVTGAAFISDSNRARALDSKSDALTRHKI